jgi:ParB family transcriptional regulator, chromosome partitioning protein
MNAKKKALGRGLDALLTGNETDVANKKKSSKQTASETFDIDIQKIQANPYQPRNRFESIALEELANSIKTLGIIQPITVRKLGDNKYQIISGERRFRASKLAGLDKIPAYIRQADDQDMLEMALVENIQREDLNAIEIAHSYERLIDECRLTQEELSKRVGKNRTTITNYLRLLKLPGVIQSGLKDNFISMGHARTIINIKDFDTQKELYQMIIDKKLSVREVEDLVRIINKGGNIKKTTTSKVELSQNTKKTIGSLNKKYDSNVDVKINASGKGNISIAFKSEDDLDRLLKLLK